MVGDLCRLEPGDLIPADGILISGENVKCVESSPTGKSDQMKKIAAYDAFVQMEAGSIGIHKLDAFMFVSENIDCNYEDVLTMWKGPQAQSLPQSGV
jgi:Ca2+-transporting ATPase